jgi:hypothetical protein
MTKPEFCEKWKRGWRELYHDGTEAYFKTEEQMLNDLDLVVYSEVIGWKEFVDSEVCKTVDLDEWQRQEAEKIQNRG